MKFEDMQALKKIDIKKYQSEMFERYVELLEYRNLINNSEVSKITISGQDVVFTITNRRADNRSYDIDMVLCEKDAAAVPVTVLTQGTYEPEELEMVSRLCGYFEDGGVFLDVGANLGWYTLNICREYPQIKSYAFEPISETFLKMKRNVEINGLDNCTIYNIGLSDENKNLSFFYDVLASGASSIVDLRELDTTVKVEGEVKKLDDWAAENKIDRVDFIKCDVEGAEFFVYQGGAKTIERCRPMIFSEMLRKWCGKFGYHPNDIIDFLGGLGYVCFVIQGKGLIQIDRVTEDTVETNYFFLHREKHKDIIREMAN